MVTSDRLRSQGKKDTHDMGINLILMKVLFCILISFLVAKQATGDSCSNHYHSYVRSKSRKIHPLLALATHNHEQMRSSATSVTSSSKELVLGIRAGADNPYVDICSTCSRESVFIGSILPTIKKVFRGGGDHYSAGFEELKKDFNLEDALIIAFVSFLFEPCLCIFHDLVANRMLKLDKKYDISLAKKVGEAVKEIGEIGIIVYCVELFTAFVEGWNHQNLRIMEGVELDENFFATFPRNVAFIAYGLWIARTLSKAKSHLLKNYLSNPLNFNVSKRAKDHMSLYPFLNRCIGALIYFLVCSYVLELTGIHVGQILKSLLAIGGLSSIAIGLALKEPLENVLSGFIMLAHGTIHVGDKVRMANGSTGYIEEIGWTETVFRGSDNISSQIPNNHMLKERISNLSKTELSQIKYFIRLLHEDIGRITEICEEIDREISTSCRNVLVNLKVHWVDIREDHVSVMVDGDFRIQPFSSRYHQTREQVLLAISRAMKKCQARFALPREGSLEYTNDDGFKWV